MKSFTQSLLIIALVLCASSAAAQVTQRSSSARVTGQPVAAPVVSAPGQSGYGTVSQPGYSNTNSLLERNVSVHPVPGAAPRSGVGVSGSSASPISSTTRGASPISGASAGSSRNPFSTGSYGSQLSSVGATTPGGSAVSYGSSSGSGLDIGDDDLMPGQLVPIGAALLPLLLMLIVYTAFRVRRKNRS